MSIRIGIGRNLQVQSSEPISFCEQYLNYLAEMTTEPSEADKAIQNVMFESLVDGGYFAKMEYGYLLANHANGGGEAYINLKSPAQYKAAESVNFGNWIQYEGVIHDGVSHALDGVFNHNTDRVLTSQNSVCVIVGLGTEVGSNFYDFYAIDAVAIIRLRARQAIGTARSTFHDLTSINSPIVQAKGHHALSRGIAANYDHYFNATKTNIVQASTGIPNDVIHFAQDKRMRYLFVFSYLTEAEIQAVMAIMESYLDNYGTGLL